MNLLAAGSPLTNAILVATTLSVAGAVLSVLVVLRRWAFVGEGIAHAGIGGAGTAWLLMLIFPALHVKWLPYVAVVVFCLLMALVIGWVTRREWINADTAIGIFLVASLAWGFLAQSIYLAKKHDTPVGWDTLIFGQMGDLSSEYLYASIALCICVLLVMLMLGKEILSYALDPIMAEVSGVPARAIHYMLMLLLAVTIIVGTKIAGGVLVTALIVLPGAAALQVSRNLKTVMSISILIGMLGALVGVFSHQIWRIIPTGPAMVLALFFLFVVSFGIGQIKRGGNR